MLLESINIDMIGIIKEIPNNSIAVEIIIKKKTKNILLPLNLNAFFDISKINLSIINL